MHHPSTLLRGGIAAIIIAASLAASACTNTNGSIAPLAKGPVTPIQVGPYNWYTVDDPAGTNNEVTGINDSREIVGNYSTGSCENSSSGVDRCGDCPLVIGGSPNTSTWTSYTSKFSSGSSGSGYTSFTPVMYPNAKSQYLSGISNESSAGSEIKVGCLVSPGGGGLRQTWGLVNNGGLWNFLAMSNSSKNCSDGTVGALAGIDSEGNGVAVGFTNAGSSESTGACPVEAWEDQPDDSHKPLRVTFGSYNASNVEATGVRSDGNFVVGTATMSNTGPAGALRGWMVKFTTNGSYDYNTQPIAYKGNPTAFTGVSLIGSETQVVGWYTSGPQTFGLVGTVSGTGSQSSQYSWLPPVKETNADTLTVISGTNSHGDICGWYNDANGNDHGFVGILTGARARRNHHQSRR